MWLIKIMLLFLLFLFLEFYLLVRMFYLFGVGFLLVELGLSALAGVLILKWVGRGWLKRIKLSLVDGELPAGDILNGFLVYLGAVFLLFPGIISDIIGVLLVFSLTRQLLKHAFWWIVVKLYGVRTHYEYF
ncbi:FxsA family protein [bacterium]|nr:FxsA family protein [bacterium]